MYGPSRVFLQSGLKQGFRQMSSVKKGTITLVSVNTAPDRAKKVIGGVIERVKDKYDIVHAGNSTTIEGVRPLLLSTKPTPDVLFCASMWTPDEQDEVQRIAKETIPGIRTYGIPTGLHTKAGPEGIIQHLSERIDGILA
ncbi:hypothetical protein I317_05081 [Kwoniella heveanensis CBS 569]|nr:hypothetical protein I317_05081 [Kwoniella heveanensis CBS 569]